MSATEKVVSLGPGDNYRVPINIYDLKPDQYTVIVSMWFVGGTRYPDRDPGEVQDEDAVWTGKIISESQTITIKPLVKPMDIAALKILWPAGKGSRYDMWRSNSKKKGGDSRFRTVLQKYPQSIFAKHAELAEARQWAGDLQPKSASSYDKVIAPLTRLLEEYPTSYITDDAELLLARVYLHREQSQPGKGYRLKAVKHLKHLQAAYPKSNSARPAGKLLRNQNSGDTRHNCRGNSGLVVRLLVLGRRSGLGLLNPSPLGSKTHHKRLCLLSFSESPPSPSRLETTKPPGEDACRYPSFRRSLSL